MKFTNIIKKFKLPILMIIQITIILTVGLIANDVWYSIVVSVIGITFNMLVSLKKSIGFLVGFIYAIGSGIIAFNDAIYATFVFMIVLQAPMAIYSFISWRKNSTNNNPLKIMNHKQFSILCIAMILLAVAMYFILRELNSSNVVCDAIFFVFSVSACLLLAFRYKNAFIVTLLSGLGGTALWLYQSIVTNIGISLAVFYIIVSVNSIYAIYTNYSIGKLKLK